MEQYVLLTGGKNNAGDFLIKHRAKKLFQELRKDRQLVDYDAWKELTDEQLDVINQSKALILTGGPSLQFGMYPNIYKLRNNLDEIKVPIVTMGIGWKSISGNWSDTYEYPLNEESKKLLNRIKDSGLLNSVRDYHTLNTLSFKDVNNVLMTGCPAYYELTHIGKPIEINPIQKVAFSLGVAMIHSKSMEENTKRIILSLKNRYKDIDFEVVFHHSLNEKSINNVYTGMSHHLKKHMEFAEWLNANSITYVDISGSAENLISYYEHVDIHIGFRVHAHIFMNSISKRSILLAEDGRGKATFNVIGGNVIDSYHKFLTTEIGLLDKVRSKLKIKLIDRYIANKNMVDEIASTISYIHTSDCQSLRNSRVVIDQNFEVMKRFINQLP